MSSGFAAPKSWGMFGGTMATAAVAGTVSQATGGKFANGAVTGAFIHLYNAWGGDDSADYAQKKALYGGQSRYTRQKNAFNMFDGASDVGDGIRNTGVVLRNPLMISVGESISTGSTLMKYHVSPDNHATYEIYNDLVSPQYTVTPAY
jgi:hypothetical protein